MSWMSWLPTLQGFLFGLAAFFALGPLNEGLVNRMHRLRLVG
jgi:hypothetical protein